MRFSCLCRNICVEVEREPRPLDSETLTKHLPENEARFAEALVARLGLLGVKTKLCDFCRDEGVVDDSWIVTRCDHCGTEAYAVPRVMGTLIVLFPGMIKLDEKAEKEVEKEETFSKVFQVMLQEQEISSYQSKTEESKIAPVENVKGLKAEGLQRLQRRLDDAVQQEKIAMDLRIEEFIRNERAKHSKFIERARWERNVLWKSLHSLQPSIPIPRVERISQDFDGMGERSSTRSGHGRASSGSDGKSHSLTDRTGAYSSEEEWERKARLESSAHENNSLQKKKRFSENRKEKEEESPVEDFSKGDVFDGAFDGSLPLLPVMEGIPYGSDFGQQSGWETEDLRMRTVSGASEEDNFPSVPPCTPSSFYEANAAAMALRMLRTDSASPSSSSSAHFPRSLPIAIPESLTRVRSSNNESDEDSVARRQKDTRDSIELAPHDLVDRATPHHEQLPSRRQSIFRD